MRIAQTEKRLLITFDKDFGELAFKQRFNTAETGIILFRIIPKSAAHIAIFAVTALESRDDWRGHFSVVEEDRIRMTELPLSDMESDQIN